MKNDKIKNKTLLRRLLLAFLILVLYFGVDYYNKTVAAPTFEKVKVTKVVDGDTFYVGPDKVRVIGINTPEFGEEKEELGEEAKIRAEELILNKTVYLKTGKELEDKYGRNLRYVFLINPKKEKNVDEKMLRENTLEGILLKEGLARCYFFKPNNDYEETFRKIEKEARENKEGMWKISTEGTTRGNWCINTIWKNSQL